MIGVIVNVLAVALGGVLGTVFSKKLSTRFTTELNKVFGVCAIGMGISSVPLMQNMPAVILAVVAGTALGLACHLGEWISRGGELMEKPIGKLLGERNGDDEDDLPREEYLSLLVTGIVLFCSSGTGIYGCLDAGMTGNATVLLSKSILDFFTAMVFACNLGAVTSLVAAPQAAVFFCAVFRRQGDLSAHDADDDRRLQGLRRLSAHRNGLPYRQDAGLPRGGHDPGDGARDAAERPMDKLHRAASLGAWKKAPLPKKTAVLAFLRYVNYNETDH